MTNQVNSYKAIFTGSTPETVEVEVIPSHWQPGYTPGHKETKLEAIQYLHGKIRKWLQYYRVVIALTEDELERLEREESDDQA